MAPAHSSKSKKSPAFQFYPADFLNDDAVEDMSFTEIGVYVVMLCKDFLSNGLPADMGKIAKRISGGKHQMTEARMRKIWEGPIAKCFDEKGERLYNPRVEYERKKQKSFLRRQTDNGALGGRPKKTHTETQAFSESKPRARNETKRDESEVLKKEKGEPLLMDVCARELLSLAPDEAQCTPLLVEAPLYAALHDIARDRGLSLRESWEWLKTRLEVHKRSRQWRDGMVKRLDRWLLEGLYLASPREEAPSERGAQSRPKPAWVKPAVSQ